MEKVRTYLPGIAIAAICSAIAFAINMAVPLLSALLVAIIIGVIIRNTGLLPTAAEPGFAFVGKTILRAGVVLLGLRLSIPEILELGWGIIAVIIITVAATYAVTLALGRALRLGHATVLLTATGTAICGAAAVAAMSAVTYEEDQDTLDESAATAIASVTLFGTLGLLAIPYLAHAMGLSAEQSGVWIGAAIHEVGQVVAGAGIGAGNMPDAAAGDLLTDTAVITKLGRVVMLAPLVTIVGALESRRAAKAAEQELIREEVDAVLSDRPVPHPARKAAPIIPLFVLGFLAMVLVRSIFTLPANVLSGFDIAATIMLTAAMVAMGAGVRLKRLVTTGGKALGLGALAAVISAVISLGALLVLA